MQAPAEKVTSAMRALEAAYLIGVEGATEIWLVRHGDCYEGMSDSTDPGLSRLGIEQARRLGERAKRFRPDAVYASPAKRALETARHIDDNIKIDQRLLEIPLELEEDGGFNFTEKPEDVTARMTAVIDQIIASHEGQRVIVVGHAGAIVNYITHVLRLEPGQLRILPFYTSVSVVRALEGRRMVGALCDTSHLE